MRAARVGSSVPPDEVPDSLVRLLENPSLVDWVAAFYESDGDFAADTFDTLPDAANDPDRFQVSDLLAVTTLDVRVRPLALRRLLFEDVDALRPKLNAIKGDCLWTASDEQLEPAFELFDHLVDGPYPWVGPTTASKLLARKRPGLLPVVDSIIKGVVGTTTYRSTVRVLRSALQREELRVLVEATRPPAVDESSAPTLRLLDCAIWMSRSASRNANHVRGHNGPNR